MLPLLVLIVPLTLSACGGGGSNSTTPPTNLSSIVITPDVTSEIALNTSKKYKAIGRYTDGSAQNLTNLVTWQSSVPNIISLNESNIYGRIKGESAGTTYITASYQNITSESAELIVADVALESLVITPETPMPSIAIYTNQQYTATGTYSDGNIQDITDDVTWNSSATNIANVYAGLASGINLGDTTISANLLGINSNHAALTVNDSTLQTMNIVAENNVLIKGLAQNYTVLGTFSDASIQNISNNPYVIWSSSESNVASIATTDGVVTVNATHSGTTNINVTTKLPLTANISSSRPLQVIAPTLESINIMAAESTILSGESTILTAIGYYDNGAQKNITQYVTWQSNANAIISVQHDTESTFAFGHESGTAIITANMYNNQHTLITSNNITLQDLPTWQIVGFAGISHADIGYVSLQIDQNDVPYVAFAAESNTSVMRFINNNWSYLGESSFAPLNNTTCQNIAIAKDDKIYVAYYYNNSPNTQVERFNSATESWELLDMLTLPESNNILLECGLSLSANVNHDSVYLGLDYVGSNGISSYINVFKLYGESWINLAESALLDVPDPAGLDVLTTSSDTPYIVAGTNYWQPSSQPEVMMFNKSDSSWQTIGESLPDVSFYYSLTPSSIASNADGSSIYIAYQYNLGTTTVMHYDGINWQATSQPPQLSPYTAQLAMAANGNVYLIYAVPHDPNYFLVMQLINNQWVQLGQFNYQFNVNSYSQVSMQIAPNGTPYVAFSDSNHNGKLTVIKYD